MRRRRSRIKQQVQRNHQNRRTKRSSRLWRIRTNCWKHTRVYWEVLIVGWTVSAARVSSKGGLRQDHETVDNPRGHHTTETLLRDPGSSKSLKKHVAIDSKHIDRMRSKRPLARLRVRGPCWTVTSILQRLQDTMVSTAFLMITSFIPYPGGSDTPRQEHSRRTSP